MTVLAVVSAAVALLMLVMPGFGPPFIAERRVVVPIARKAHLVGGLGALGLASSSQEGFVTHVGFGMLAVLWLTATLQAYRRNPRRRPAPPSRGRDRCSRLSAQIHLEYALNPCRFPVLFCCVALVGCKHAREPDFPTVLDGVYAPGQVWSFKAPAEQSRAILTVLRLDSVPGLGTVVHVRLDSLDMSETGRVLNGQHIVQHMPFVRAAIDSSVMSKLVDSGSIPEYADGYAQWRRAKGGAFSVAVGSFLRQLAETNKAQGK